MRRYAFANAGRPSSSESTRPKGNLVKLSKSALGWSLALLAVCAVLQAEVPREEKRPAAIAQRSPDVIYVPTPPAVIEAMLWLAEVDKGDVLYDLGSGDGRIPITAARLYGVRAVGIDINPERIKEANANSREAGTTALVSFRSEDLFEANIAESTVVTLYLLESLNQKLRPKLLRELRRTRIVSHTFGMGDWAPEKRIDVGNRSVYLWRVPEKTANADAAPAGLAESQPGEICVDRTGSSNVLPLCAVSATFAPPAAASSAPQEAIAIGVPRYGHTLSLGPLLALPLSHRPAD